MLTTSGNQYMKSHIWRSILVSAVLTIFWAAATVESINVTYDHRALIIDGKRRFLQSGSIHYPRSTPEMWPQLMNLAKEGGLDIVETYVFWDKHEPHRGTVHGSEILTAHVKGNMLILGFDARHVQYNFAGNHDLVKFIKLAASAGLFVNLRIGPYVCAEWNFGGFPAWLRFIPGIEFRTDNQPFKVTLPLRFDVASFVTRFLVLEFLPI